MVKRRGIALNWYENKSTASLVDECEEVGIFDDVDYAYSLGQAGGVVCVVRGDLKVTFIRPAQGPTMQGYNAQKWNRPSRIAMIRISRIDRDGCPHPALHSFTTERLRSWNPYVPKERGTDRDRFDQLMERDDDARALLEDVFGIFDNPYFEPSE